MNPLDSKTILALRKVLNEGTQPCPPYAIEYDDSIIVTNQSWLMEWPKELVDLECAQFNKLLDGQKHELAKNVGGRLLERHWTEVLFDPAGKYVSVKEVEPEDGKIVMQYRNVQHLYYNWVNFEATEMFVPDASFKLYRQPPDQNIADIMRMLVVYEDDKMVGVFANDQPP